MLKLKKIGSKFLGGMVLLAIVYSLAKNGYISHASNSIEEAFSHNCKNLVTQAAFQNTSKTYKEAFGEYFKDADWSYFDSKKGNIVEFKGKCNYMNQEVNCTIQFLISGDKKSFEPAYFGFNDIPQNTVIYRALLQSIENETAQSARDTQPKKTNMNTNINQQNNNTNGGDTIHNNPNYVPDGTENNEDFNEHPEKYGIATEGSDVGC